MQAPRRKPGFSGRPPGIAKEECIMSFKQPAIFLLLFLVAACSPRAPKDPLEVKVAGLLTEVATSAVELHRSMKEIKKKSRQNTPERLTEAILIIERAENQLSEANRSLQVYGGYVRQNRAILGARQLNHYIEVNELLSDTLARKRKFQGEYLRAHKRWMVYVRDHFDALEGGRDTKTRMVYQRLLTDSRRGLKKFDAAGKKYLWYVSRFTAKHPGLVVKFFGTYKRSVKELGWNVKG